MATFLAKIKVFEGKEAEFEETARMMYTNTPPYSLAQCRHDAYQYTTIFPRIVQV